VDKRELIERCREHDVKFVRLQFTELYGLHTLDAYQFGTGLQPLKRSASLSMSLAGFMRILDTAFVEAWRDRLVNIHPSLLPAFPGLHAQRQALAAGVRFSGCTVHFVRAEVDTGPIIAQAAVPVHAGDNEEILSERILAAEHRIYPMAVRLIAEGRLRIKGDRVTIAGAVPPGIALFNPSEVLASPDG